MDEIWLLDSVYRDHRAQEFLGPYIAVSKLEPKQKTFFSKAGKDNGSQSCGWLSNDGLAKNQWNAFFGTSLMWYH